MRIVYPQDFPRETSLPVVPTVNPRASAPSPPPNGEITIIHPWFQGMIWHNSLGSTQTRDPRKSIVSADPQVPDKKAQTNPVTNQLTIRYKDTGLTRRRGYSSTCCCISKDSFCCTLSRVLFVRNSDKSATSLHESRTLSGKVQRLGTNAIPGIFPAINSSDGKERNVTVRALQLSIMRKKPVV